MQKLEEKFVAIWCVLMPVTGTLLVPSIQGTIPAYMLAFCSVIFVFFRLQRGEMPQAVMSYAKSAVVILLIWLFFLVASQVGALMSHRHDFSDVGMIDPSDPRIVFRKSLFTQSLYLAACCLITLYFRYFFQESWMRYVFYGAYFMAGYGIYEWTYFLVFHQPGDFLVNRTFGDTQHTASWSQSINFGGLNLLRIKSTLGEPSFFAAVVIPYLFVALDYRKAVLSGMLIFTALFSTSTSCFIGLGSCLLVKCVWTGRLKASYFFILALVGAFLLAMAHFYPDTFNNLFAQKFSGDNDSGKARLDNLAAVHDLLGSFTIPNWLFGVGFGYVYNDVFLAALINTGVLGLLAFLFVLLHPILLLPIKPGSEGVKLGLLGIAILCAVTLSELFLPTTWMFLGIAYRKLEESRRAPEPVLRPVPEPLRRDFSVTHR